jgi:hypothetical protein
VECEYAYDISVVLDDGTGHLTASLVSSAAHAALQVQKKKTLFIKNIALPHRPRNYGLLSFDERSSVSTVCGVFHFSSS